MTSPPQGSVLLLGGTGKVARHIAPLLRSAGMPALIASRSGGAPDGHTGVVFNWHDKSTWDRALATPGLPPVRAVFVVAPYVAEPGPLAGDFIDLACAKGVKRFVLLSASLVPEGGQAMGQIHKYLRDLGDQGKLEWAVLRPTWFQENFSENRNHLKSIKEEKKIYSATGAGRIPWVACSDIAAVGFHALTAPEAPNRDYVILGDALYAYADLAKIFTEVLGRQITYHELTEAELAQRHQDFGLPADYAHALAKMDSAINSGAEDRVNDVVLTTTGQKPVGFREFVEANKAVWL